MLDLLLVYPPLSINERYGRNVGNIGGHQPPLGLACLAAYVRENGFSVKIIDAQAEGISTAEAVELARKYNPKVIGIGALTSIFHRAVEFARDIKCRIPQSLIIFGGHHASIMSEETMSNFNCFDLLCKGEGEYTLTEVLVNYKKSNFDKEIFLKNTSVLSGINGIVYRDGEKICSTAGRMLISDLDELPMPARDLLKIPKYNPMPNQYKRLPLLNITVSRGCPFGCSYCSASSVFGRGIRMRAPDKTIEEIKFLMSEYNAKEISFWDDTITFDKKWLSRLCSLILEQQLGITWTCYSRVDSVTKDMLKIMKEAGCWNIFFGFESGDQNTLDLIGKKITLDQIRTVCKWCKELGIEIRASFMIALPNETPELAKKTIDFAVEVDPDYAQFCITTPFPKTRLYEEAIKYGLLENDFSKYNVWQPVFVPFGYKNRDEILKMEKLAMRRFYMRPGYIFNKIKKMNSFEDFIRYLKGFRLLLGFLK